DHIGVLGQDDAQGLFRRVRRIEQAQLDLVGVFGEESEVDPGTVPGGAERIGMARPDAHTGSLVAGEKAAAGPRDRGPVPACVLFIVASPGEKDQTVPFLVGDGRWVAAHGGFEDSGADSELHGKGRERVSARGGASCSRALHSGSLREWWR